MSAIGYTTAKTLVHIEPHIAMKGAWSFKPAFAPYEMLYLGVFGRNYFSNATAEDFKGLDAATAEAAKGALGARGSNSWVGNCFGVKAGMDYDWWKKKGLITPEDPLGWFHWYCRYYNGRRIPKLDNWQIARWQNFHRWLVNGKNQFVKNGVVSRVVLQSLLHWAYNPLECFDAGHKFDNVRPPIPMQERED